MFRFFLLVACMLGLTNPVWALSCEMSDPKVTVNSADLIAKAKIVEIENYTENPDIGNNSKQKITFEILDVYKGDQELLGNRITANFSSVMRLWGPTIAEEQENEFLFIYNNKEEVWEYFGPGGCTYLNDDVWELLRTREYPNP